MDSQLRWKEQSLELVRNTDGTPEQEREQKQIIRFLNLLVTDDSSAASAQSN